MNKPREFQVKGHSIKDMGKIGLSDGEMITLLDGEGKECDIVAWNWGFYLGPSINDRIVKAGFKVALVLNENGQMYINAVNRDKLDEFLKYLQTGQNSTILCWLDEWIPKFQKEDS